jgi:pyruvate kinase
MEKFALNRHTRIVCTVGPASSSQEIIEKMMLAGMDIARFNLAYGTFKEHSRQVALLRKTSEKLKHPLGILMDLPGTKRRKGDIENIYGNHLDFVTSQDADFIALSFISSAQQVQAVRGLLREMKSSAPVIVKIERSRALEDIEAILDNCDGIMVARGDLALDISIEKVPLAQKYLIRQANQRGKPVITATQMLESMVRSASPTRAEATDVANAILDGTDAIMLSEESAIGSYPVESAAMMAKIAIEAEKGYPYEQKLSEKWQDTLPEVDDAAARAACQMARQVQAKVIVAFTFGGTTAIRVSKYRPSQPILAITPSETVVRRLTVAWGVHPFLKPDPVHLEGMFDLAAETALETGAARKGELVVLVAGLPISISGHTNLVKIHRI